MRLYVMTGDFMTGKTTWIMQMLDAAEDAALTGRPLDIAGIVSPAVFEHGRKTGIDALLLPDRERFGLARPRNGGFVDERAHHASGDDSAGAESGGAPASPKLGWRFDETAMERINRHLASPACASCDLLVVDELGPLELLRGGGYTRALRLLDAGAPKAALAVIRPALLDAARKRWGAFEELTPQSDIDAFLASL